MPFFMCSAKDNVNLEEYQTNKEEKNNLIKSIELLKQKNTLDLKSYEETIQRQVKEKRKYGNRKYSK